MRERRKNFRVEWNSAATIYNIHGRSPRPCIVSNLSNGGAKITGVQPDTIPDRLMLRVSPHGRARKCHVLWRSKDALGVAFTDVPKPIEEPARQPRAREVANAHE